MHSLPAALPAEETAALTQLANAWTSKPASWNVDDVANACTTWTGLACVNDHVYSIQLAGSSLAGSVPASALVSLTQMTIFNVSRNSLSGTLPSNFGTNVLVIDLSFNDFTGSLPASWSNLGVTTLLVNNNNLTGCVPASWPGNLQQSLNTSVGLGCNLSGNNWNCSSPSCYEHAPSLCQTTAAHPMCPAPGEAPTEPFVAHMTPVQIAGICVGAALIAFLAFFLIRKFACNNQKARYEPI